MNADSRNGCRAIPRAMRTRSATTPHLVPVADQTAAVLAPDHSGLVLPPDLAGTVVHQFLDMAHHLFICARPTSRASRVANLSQIAGERLCAVNPGHWRPMADGSLDPGHGPLLRSA